MNDFDKTKKFLEDIDIDYEIVKNDKFNNDWYGEEVILMSIWAQRSNKVDGYAGTGADFVFSKDKRLIKIVINGD